MRKSLFVTLEFSPQKGGTQNYYFNICKNLPSGKIVVLAPRSEKNPTNLHYRGGPNMIGVGGVDGAFDFKIYRKNLLVKYLYPHWLTIIWHLYRIIKRDKIELIQVGQILPCGAAVFLINKFFKIPYIVYTHGLDILGPQKNSRKKKLMIKVLRNAKKIISNSEFTKNEVAKLGIEKGKIFVVYPSVKTLQPPFAKGGKFEPPLPPIIRACLEPAERAAIAEARVGDVDKVLDTHLGIQHPQENAFEELKKKYNLSGKKILLTVCRLVERKGVDLVISALAKFSEELKDIIYVVVGDGPKMEDLKRVAVICPQIIFTGKISDEELDLWYNVCDVFILTPKKSEFDAEGFGIVYIEAGSYSKPVIGSDAGGICEAIKNGETGILVEPDDVEQIGETIVKLFNDKKLRERLGIQGRERTEREFGVAKQMMVLRNAIE